MEEYIKRLIDNDKTFIKLDIGYNNIDVKGCKYLSDALKHNQTLTTLSITAIPN